MKQGRFSRTAFRGAICRTAHQLFDQPNVLDDPLALPIIGDEAAERRRANPKERQHPVSRAFRAFTAARSRYAVDQLAKAIEWGATQYGRSRRRPRHICIPELLCTAVERFEVDHPATQAWKLECLPAARITVPASFEICPVRFRETNTGGRTRTGWLRLTLARALLVAGSCALSHTGIVHGDPALHRATASGHRRSL